MNNKSGAIAEAMAKINKKYGNNTVVTMDKENVINVEVLPTGCYSLDYVLGCGGLPRGRILELYGQESSGKSTLAMFIAGQVQKAGGKVVWMDAEFCFSTEYAKKIGVDTDNLIVCQPETAEEAFEIISELVATNEIDLVVLDSVAALATKQEIDSEVGKESMAMQARVMSRVLRVMAGRFSRTKTAMLFINQVREKVGIYFGDKKTTPGGKALKFYSSVRIEVSKKESMKDKNDMVFGNKMGMRGVKNKVGYPFRVAEVDVIYEKGIDMVADALDTAMIIDVVTKKGNTLMFGDEKLGVGRSQAKDFLESNPKILENIRKEIKKNEEKIRKQGKPTTKKESEGEGEDQ